MKKKCLLFILSIILFSCKNDSKTASLQTIEGQTMGTYYAIKYPAAQALVSKRSLDSILIAINDQVSTYIPTSTISQLNSEQTNFHPYQKSPENEHFINNCLISKDIYNLTKGNFDPTVNPLVNFWGFGYDKKTYEDKDLNLIPDLLKSVGFGKWEIRETKDSFFIKKPNIASLDFSAVAKGYALDRIAIYFNKKKINNYFIDIGGEARIKGLKSELSPWVIAVNKPVENGSTQDAMTLMTLNNQSIATSGNYRNFYEENGLKYVHTINPFTGMSEPSSLLSASIIHESCAIADAVATACMVMGLDQSIQFLSEHSDFEGLFIYNDENGSLKQYQSVNLAQQIIN